MRKAGVKEPPKKLTEEQVADERAQLLNLAKRKGWLT
jgi:hypothetical protein